MCFKLRAYMITKATGIKGHKKVDSDNSAVIGNKMGKTIEHA